MTERRRKRKGTLGAIAAVGVLAGLAWAATLGGGPRVPLREASQYNARTLSIPPTDRVLILAPHPDDETLGTGGVIEKALAAGAAVQVVFLTNGDANEWSFVLYSRRPEVLPGQVAAMGEVRRGEAVAATGVLGLKPEDLTFLGYPDFGTLRIWERHWSSEPAFLSLFTHVTAVPYKDAYRPGASYKGEDIQSDLEAAIKAFGPTKVFVSHPADYNPDHEALYLFTQVALWDLDMTPEVYPYLVHTPAWPLPRGAAPNRELTPPNQAGQETWWTLSLDKAEIDRKQAALEQHRTQYLSNSAYLASFIRANELFGDYPVAALPSGDVDLAPDGGDATPQPPPGLTEEEQAKFVGVEWRKVQRDGNDLVLTASISKPLAEGVGLSAYLFGYRQDKPFAEMPKIHVRVGALMHEVLDQTKRVPDKGVVVTRTSEEIEIRVPLALLGDPDRALISARTYLGQVPLDGSAWRVLDLRAEG